MENGTVTYKALQRLTERAWDEMDQENLLRLSTAVDSITARMILEAAEATAACE